VDALPIPFHEPTQLQPGDRLESNLRIPGTTTGPVTWRLITTIGGGNSPLEKIDGTCK
jgi:hypothetical protein